MSDEQELADKMAQNLGYPLGRPNPEAISGYDAVATPPQVAYPGGVAPTEKALRSLVQWSTADDKTFVPCSRTSLKLRPGLYEPNVSPQIGLYFQAIPTKTEGLLRLPHTNSERVLSEIQTFWEKRDVFAQYGLPHKRGILLWGPPGSGKSSTVQMVMRDVIERGGVGINFTHPTLFTLGLRALREIQPETPVVVLMEDIDSIIRQNSESEVLNLLDGAESVEHVVFLASTNYPELLGPRIVNRPSRFDRRFKVDHPNEASRRVYLEHLIGTSAEVDLDLWVADTKGLSLAHLKELFVAVVVLGDQYGTSLELLKSMREIITSEREGKQERMGYALNEARALGVYSDPMRATGGR